MYFLISSQFNLIQQKLTEGLLSMRHYAMYRCRVSRCGLYLQGTYSPVRQDNFITYKYEERGIHRMLWEYRGTEWTVTRGSGNGLQMGPKFSWKK